MRICYAIKNSRWQNADGAESKFVLTILEKIKETRLNFSTGSSTLLWIMVNYQEARIKRRNTQLNKNKSVAKITQKQHWE